MNLVAFLFAMQPVCNATQAAHALHSDQNAYLSPTSLDAMFGFDLECGTFNSTERTHCTLVEFKLAIVNSTFQSLKIQTDIHTGLVVESPQLQAIQLWS